VVKSVTTSYFNLCDLKSISSTFYEQLLRRYSFAKKIQTVMREKLHKALLYKKDTQNVDEIDT